MGRLIVRMDGGLMQPLKLAPACLGSRTRDGSHGTREKKPHYSTSIKAIIIESISKAFKKIPFFRRIISLIKIFFSRKFLVYI